MKKICVLFLVLIVIFCGCSKKDNNEILTVDYENALVCQKELKSSGEHGSVIVRIPKINVDLNNANSLSEKMESELSQRYESLKDSSDDVVIDYSYTEELDIITILITEKRTVDGGEKIKANVYYYDALSDSEMSEVDYINSCGAVYKEIFNAVNDTDWAKGYTEETGNSVTDDMISAIVYIEDNDFTLYMRKPNEQYDTAITVTAEDISLTLPNIS